MTIGLKKRFLAIYICISFLTVSFYSFYKTQEVYADALALSAIGSGISIAEAGGAITSALSVAALPALVVVGGAVTCGVVYKNRRQIKDFAIGAMGYLNSVGQGIGQGIVEMGNGVVKITSGAKTALLDYIGSIKGDLGGSSDFNVPIVNSINVPAKTIVRTNIVIPFSKELDIKIGMINTGNITISNCGFRYRIEGYPDVVLKGRQNDSICFYPPQQKLYCGQDSVLLPTYGNICVDVENGGSHDVSIGIVQKIPRDKSICSNVGDIPTFKDNYFSQSTDTYITPSKTATWDDVIGLDGAIPSTVGTISDSIPNISNPDLDLPSMELPTEAKLDFSPLYVNFKDRFPFSIPFDIYNVFKTFSTAERTPPKFDVEFDKGLVGKASFTIDLDQFDLVARLLRYFLLIMFLIGLMKITRNIIRA